MIIREVFRFSLYKMYLHCGFLKSEICEIWNKNDLSLLFKGCGKQT
jgi:hypothetical protein